MWYCNWIPTIRYVIVHDDDLWRVVIIYDALGRSVVRYGLWWSLMPCDRLWWFATVRYGLWWSLIPCDCLWWSMMIHDGPWGSMMGHDGSWWFMMVHDGSWWLMLVECWLGRDWRTLPASSPHLTPTRPTSVTTEMFNLNIGQLLATIFPTMNVDNINRNVLAIYIYKY